MSSSEIPPQARGASVDHGREPCPDRILDDMGGAFGMGAVGGGLWHFFKGLKNSPSNARMRGGLEVFQSNHTTAVLCRPLTLAKCENGACR